jgi:Zn-finger nucleic acid-binding protein
VGNDDAALCPSCSAPLIVTSAEGRREYVCSACGGMVMTIAALGFLSPGTARAVWAQEPQGEPDGPPLKCPFCSRPMAAEALASGHAAVCRPCESVWLDKQACASVTVRAGAPVPAATLAGTALHCPQCGAPISSSDEEQCRYCGATLQAPVKVVVLPEGTPVSAWAARDHGAAEVIGELLGGIVDKLH